MPELPEVESARAMVQRCCGGLKIVKANVYEQGGGPRDGLFDDKICDEGVAPEQLRAALEGRILKEVGRRGKQMFFITDKAPHTLWHFGMTGFFYVQGDVEPRYQRFTPDLSVWPPRFCKYELQFEGGVKLAFCDPRRLGKVKIRASPLEEAPISKLGLDPVLCPPTPEAFVRQMRRYSAPVKAVLLDQNKVLCGVGNWIADEACYQARVHPAARCDTLSDAQLAEVLAKTVEVCRFAVQVDAQSDRFPKSWMFHYRWGKGAGGAATIPGGHRIVFDEVGGRTTAVVAKVQKMGALSAAEVKASKEKASSDAKAGKKEKKKEEHSAKGLSKNGQDSNKRKVKQEKQDAKDTTKEEGPTTAKKSKAKKGRVAATKSEVKVEAGAVAEKGQTSSGSRSSSAKKGQGQKKRSGMKRKASTATDDELIAAPVASLPPAVVIKSNKKALPSIPKATNSKNHQNKRTSTKQPRTEAPQYQIAEGTARRSVRLLAKQLS